LTRLATREEFAAEMVRFRETRQVSEKWTKEGIRFNKGRPTVLRTRYANPLASDGKNLWQELVIKPGKALGTKLKREGSSAIRDAVKRKGG
jgi:hypothetical protein